MGTNSGGQGHFPWQIAGEAISRTQLLEKSLACFKGRRLHPSVWRGWTAGGVGGHHGRCVPPGGRAVASRCRRGCASRLPGNFHCAQRADNGPGSALSLRRRPSPRCGAGGRRRFLGSSSPRPRGLRARCGRRKSQGEGVAAAATRVAGPGKQRGDVCGLKSGNRAPVGAGRARCALARPIVRRAQGHTRWTRNERILPPLISPPIAPHKQQGPVAPGGFLMG